MNVLDISIGISTSKKAIEESVAFLFLHKTLGYNELFS